MTHAGLGTSRVQSAARRLKELNPRLEIEAIDRNLDAQLADRLVAQADVVVDCAPLFVERFAMNDAALRHGKPLVECAMYDLEAHLFTVLPGQSACLRCLYPETPPAWRREFPVFGAVSGTVGCLGAMEAIKLLAGFGQPLTNRMLIADLRTMAFRQVQLQPRATCAACPQVRNGAVGATARAGCAVTTAATRRRYRKRSALCDLVRLVFGNTTLRRRIH